MTAMEARKITDDNQPDMAAQNKRDIELLEAIILKTAKSGNDIVSVKASQVNQSIIGHFENNGYNVEYKPALTLMDSCVYLIKW